MSAMSTVGGTIVAIAVRAVDAMRATSETSAESAVGALSAVCTHSLRSFQAQRLEYFPW